MADRGVPGEELEIGREVRERISAAYSGFQLSGARPFQGRVRGAESPALRESEKPL